MESHAIPYSSTPITTSWTFKQGGLDSSSSHLPANNLPTEIHRDLLKNGKIARPFYDLNELSVRWVADQTWTYRTTFQTPPDLAKLDAATFLRFEGLDTYASAYLNGKLLLESENMFMELRVNVSDLLKDGDNTLEIVFESARQKGLELVQKHKEHRFIVHQTEISRGPVRKAQYHWGWDWGPLLLTCGPWKPIYLEMYKRRLSSLQVDYELSADLKSAKVKVKALCDGNGGHVQFELLNRRSGECIKKVTVRQDANAPTQVEELSFQLENIELWWPKGYGPQSLYTFRADALVETEGGRPTSVHSISQTLGFRKVELVQEPDSHGTSFYFRINNIDVYSGGSCWIPADSFLTEVSDERYKEWVALAAEGNQTMLRIWGGGIYEADAMYEAADELGVLIWQDFAFACANYPAYESYLKSVEEEARQNVRRLRTHPSIVIWAGNNEDYQIVERYNLEYRYKEDKDPNSWLKTNFPARYIYEYLLPKVIAEETTGVPYHPSSPFGNGTSTVLKVDPTVGDVHQWNVWHGTMQPYQQLPEMGGRFVSEFGMEAYPHVSTLEEYITKSEDRYPGSMVMDFRNKAIGHERRLVSYVAENFRIRYDLRGFTHLTQVMQADAMSWAYKSWRRDWGTPGNRKCGGVLVWQLNDCWPTMSWAVVDYHLVPKPAFYAIKRAMEPVVVGVQRKFKNWTMRPADELWQRDTSHIDMRQIWENIELDVWVASSKIEQIEGKVTIKFISVKSGNEVYEPIVQNVLISPNGTTGVLKSHKIKLPETEDSDKPFDISKADPFIVHAILTVGEQQVATDSSWPDPIKYLSFPDRGVKVSYPNKTKISVSAERPVKGFVLSEKKGVKLSDNGFDIMPGETYEVTVQGCAADSIGWTYIDM